MKKRTHKWFSLLLALVMVLGLLPAMSLTASAAQYIDSVEVTSLAEPWVGQTPDTDVTVSDHVTVTDIFWWWDSSGNGASDEERCTEFKQGGKYYCRIKLAAADGYAFANKATISRRNVVYQYTGTITVNGKALTGTFHTSADGSTMTFDWWKDAARYGAYIDNDKTYVVTDYSLTITGQPQNVLVAKGRTTAFTVEVDGLEPSYQWYAVLDGTTQKVGTDSPKLTVTNAFDGYETAMFYCVVSNALCEVKSDTAKMTLTRTPVIEAPVTEDPVVRDPVIKDPLADKPEEPTAEEPADEKPIPEKEIKFVDVKEDAYYNRPVTWAVHKGITVGTAETTFSPDAKCTRAQIITFLWRAAGSPEPKGACPFTDVPAGSYYEKAVTWAAEQGMVSGDTFAPNAPCTREMAVEFMWGQAGRPKAPAASFTDVSSEAVNWAVQKGVTMGTSETTFSPNATCTRAQIVSFLWRAFAE